MQLKPFDLLPPPIKDFGASPLRIAPQHAKTQQGKKKKQRERDLTSPSTGKQPINHRNNRYTTGFFSPCQTLLPYKNVFLHSTFSPGSCVTKKKKRFWRGDKMKFTKISRAKSEPPQKSPSLSLLPVACLTNNLWQCVLC